MPAVASQCRADSRRGVQALKSPVYLVSEEHRKTIAAALSGVSCARNTAVLHQCALRSVVFVELLCERFRDAQPVVLRLVTNN